MTFHALRMKPLRAAAAGLAALAVLATAASAAHAAASDAAKVTDVHVQLIDLDTTDGITFGQGAGMPALLHASFSNTGPGDYAGYVKVTTSAYSASVTAVPEPQSASLLLAGLAVLGAGATRRRSQAI